MSEIMEVHHQPHTERKRLKHYLFEFLMLFLAISAGFFVENMREHFVEKKRAKVLAASLLTDLQKDTAQIGTLQKMRETKKLLLDSLYKMMRTPPEKIDQKTFYYLLHWTQYSLYFIQSTGTINQLKNAGYLRYFSGGQLLNHISEYDFIIQDFKGDENLELHWIFDKFVDFVELNFDTNIMDKMRMEDQYPTGMGVPQLNPDVLHRLNMIISHLRYQNRILNSQNEKLKTKTVEIMTYLHTEYHLK